MERCIHFYIDNIKNLASHNFEDAPFFMFEGDVVDSGFEALPPPNYELPPKFPFCCGWHSSVFANNANWFSRFPDCCEFHKKLSRKPWFRREAFANVPIKIVKTLSFTTQHIQEVVKNPDWYKDITDYIEYCLDSFGTPGVGSNVYLADLLEYLAQVKIAGLSKSKKESLIEYISQQKSGSASAPVDLNLLYTIFQRWLNTLPNLDALSAFKSHYSGKVPADFLFYDTEYNPYLGLSKAKIRTRKQLVKKLLKFTQDILAGINTRSLVHSTDTNTKHQIDVAGSNHTIKQNIFLRRYSKGELKYVEVVQGWLQNELDYFTFIKPLLGQAGLLAADALASNVFHFAAGSTAAIVQGNNANQKTTIGADASIKPNSEASAHTEQ